MASSGILSPELLEDVLGMESRIKERLVEAVAAHRNNVQNLMAKGKIANIAGNSGSICHVSLILAQLAITIHKDIDMARDHLAFPLGEEAKPGFGDVCRYIDEGMRGLRLWDNVKISVEGELERVICFILTDRLSEMATEYEFCDVPDFLHKTDYYYSARSVFTLHLLLAGQARYDEIRDNAYAKTWKFDKSFFNFGYHTLLYALARGNAKEFSDQLQVCSLGFKKRKSSRQLDTIWGYGKTASAFCFDVLGTAICKLAVRRGLQFEAPEERWYPQVFWKGQ